MAFYYSSATIDYIRKLDGRLIAVFKLGTTTPAGAGGPTTALTVRGAEQFAQILRAGAEEQRDRKSGASGR
mgnify:CR=1 FL=1